MTFLFIKVSIKIYYDFPQQNLVSQLFSILITITKNIDHQISIFEWFLKDHVTLKTSNIAGYEVRIKT